MGIHKGSKAEAVRKYARSHTDLTYTELAEQTGVNVQYVRNVLNTAKRKAKLKRKAGNITMRAIKNTSAGIKLEGGYYTIGKLKEIVNALETLNKLMAEENDE